MSTFFKELHAMGLNSVNIEIFFDKTQENHCAVIVKPKTTSDDPALNNMPPLVMKGTVQEMDEKFFEVIRQPLTSVASLFSTAEQFMATVKEADKNAKHAKAEKEAADKAKKDEKEKAEKEAKAKKEKFEKAVAALDAFQSSEGYEPKKDKEKTLKLIDAILEIEPEHKATLTHKEEFIKATSTVDLFSAEDDEFLNQ